MKIAEKLLINFYSEIIQYLDSIKKLTENDPDAKSYYNELGKNLYNAEISGLISDDEITQKAFLKLFKRLDQISKDIRDMDLGMSFDDASDFYDNFKSESRLREGKEVKEFTETDFNRQRYYLEENIDPKSQRSHKGKSGKFGSAYKKLIEKQEGIRKIYSDINDVLAGTDVPDVEWTDDGKKMWRYLMTVRKPVELLSSTTNKERKADWIKSTFKLPPPVIFRRSHDKHEFSEPGAVLIDNKPETIESWEEKGGIGILHKNADDTIKQLQKLGI